MESSELLTILEQLERDKGINKEVLIEAVESAVSSAAKKLWTVDRSEDIRVVLDMKSGKITAYAGDEEIRSEEFGRIAAQTAKQVVIQKIREAEKDVIFSEYQERIGEIISGAVYRFEKGNIVVDLGKSEAYIPRSEQSSKEDFRQGDRIRAFVLDVRRENRGPQVVLSRSHPSFLKRLFELEVPEIFEGIVEIKSIARDVGDRTKIAVYSKDDKIDCVGACVGMRGARVKNIVTELQGEKIDIVRFSSDIKEYIQAALSPAEISQIQLGYEDKKANIIVADDQLSLAIGKKGQNVRLASQLVGWELELFSFEQWNRLQEEENALDEEDEETGEEEGLNRENVSPEEDMDEDEDGRSEEDLLEDEESEMEEEVESEDEDEDEEEEDEEEEDDESEDEDEEEEGSEDDEGDEGEEGEEDDEFVDAENEEDDESVDDEESDIEEEEAEESQEESVQEERKEDGHVDEAEEEKEEQGSESELDDDSDRG